MHLTVWFAVTALTLLLFVAGLVLDGKEPWAWLEAHGNASRIGPINNWGDGKPPAIHYSERIYWENLFRTRMNTWSNMAFVVIGFYALALGWRDRHESTAFGGYLARTPSMSFLFGFGCVSLGLGSGLYHASLTRIGQQLDVTTMWMPLLALIAISIGRWVPRINWGHGRAIPMEWVTTTVFVIATFIFHHYMWEWSSKLILFHLIGIVTAFGIMDFFRASSRLQIRWLLLAGAFLALGFLCRELDAAGRFSGPDDWWQGHSLWHVFAALCLLSTYGYHRSERVREKKKASSNHHTVSGNLQVR